jgi:hypothetical protein
MAEAEPLPPVIVMPPRERSPSDCATGASTNVNVDARG